MTPVIDLYMLVLTLIATGQCIKHTRVHEHIFISVRIEKEISIICSTCSSLL
jgi:hypothetical protein